MSVRLRPFARPDLPDLLAWVDSADALLQWSGPAFTWPLDEEQLERNLASAGPELLLFGVDAGGEHVGHLSLSLLRAHDVGYVGAVLVAPHARGRGIATALVREVARLSFEELGLHKLELFVFDFNAAAIACYERVGFRREGLLRESRKGSGGYWNRIPMGLLSSELVDP